MRKRLFVFLIVFLTLFAGSLTVYAEEGDGAAGTSGFADDILSEFSALLPEGFSVAVTDADALGEAVGVRAVFAAIFSAVEGESTEALSFFALLMGTALFFSLASVLRDGAGGTSGEVCEAALSAVFSVVIFERLRIVCEKTAEGLSEAGRFFGGLLPLFGTVTVAGGGTSLAASQALTMELSLSVLSAVTDGVLLPLASAMFAVGLLGAVGGESGSLSAVVGSMRRTFTWLFGMVTAVFAATLSLQSVIASAADSAAMRAAKVAAADLLPLVGGTVSGALSASAGALSYVKSTVGVSSVAALLFLSLPYLVRLLLYRAAFGIAGGFLSFTGAKTGERTLVAFRAALDTLTALTALSLLLYLFEIVCFMKCGVAMA